jgi:sulfur-oxidizing protein SoxB
MDVDIKMASRVRGIDASMGGHTHDGMPIPVIVDNAGGKTIVTNAGSNSKFLGVLDFNVVNGNVQGFKYRLLPVFSNFLIPDAEMEKLITKIREPFESKLNERLGLTADTLYRRGNFNGTFDQVIVDALMDVKGAEIAFSPGFRWGTSLLPNTEILMENLMDQTATTYSYSTLTEMKGSQIKAIMEDVADNLFNPDPYYQQGGDMVRVGGMQYAIEPNAKMGSRIQDMRLNGKLIDANKAYKVAGWAPVAEGASGEPVWDVVAAWIKDKKTIPSVKPNVPRIIGMDGNPGLIS